MLPNTVTEPGPSQAEPNTVTEPDTIANPDAPIYRIDRDRLVEQNCQWLTAWDERAWARALEHHLNSCQKESNETARHLKDRDQTIKILEQRLKSCQEERDDVTRDLRDVEEMFTRTLKSRWELITSLGQMIENVGEYVTRHIPYVEAHHMSRYLEILRTKDDAILQRDGDFIPNLATCCASIMAEPHLLQLCIALLAGFQKEKKYMQDANGVLFERVLRLRRTLFTFRKRVWTVAIVRGVGDMMAGQEPPPLTDFYSIGKGDDTHLVCGSVADIPASPSTSFKSYVVDDVFIAKTNAQIGGVLPPLTRRAYGKHDVCFIADGQSGSGKSYTLFNGPNALAPLMGRDILNTKRQGEYTLTCTALEVCQDGLKDLLSAEGSPTTGPPESRSPKGKKPRALVNHLSELITSEAQLRSLLTQACQRRRVSATGANMVSSRGHMICTLTIESGTRASPESTRVVIVDLAGSERRRGESLTDDEKAETMFINNSRTEVRRALLALTNNQIPAKDSMVRATPIDRGRFPADLMS